MAKELKIYIDDPVAVEQSLVKFGCQLVKSESERHTYYRQPKGHVLKIVESAQGNQVIEFDKQGAGFVRTRKESIPDTDALKHQLESEHGIEDTLDMTCRTFTKDDLKFSLYHIDNVGEFLVLTAETPDPAVFEQLGLHDPKQVTVSFNQLPKLN